MAAGFPVKANYATGDVLTATNMNDLSGTVNLVSGTQIASGKNTLINGSFQIWQRGTSSSGNAYLADRWYSALISGTGTFAQETTVVPTGSTNSIKFTASATAQPALYQAIETANAIKFAGQTVTVSGVVAASASTGFTIDVQHSASTDNSVTGTWTSITATSGGTATATSTTFVSISGVYAIPSTAKSLRVRIFTTSTIANGVIVYFDNAQLELGSTASAFQTATGTIQGELAACQRYFRLADTAAAVGQNSTNVQMSIQHTGMRVAPTVATSAALTITDVTTANFTQSSGNIAIQDNSVNGGRYTASNFTGITNNRFYIYLTSGGSIQLSAEL